jgi:RNA polymerase sigma-70 factor (ECF subfamily)
VDKNCNKEQEVQLLYKCISQLAQTDRLIISMVLEDTPYEEIASIIGITENNLRVKIHRIKKQLTEIYNRHAQL